MLSLVTCPDEKRYFDRLAKNYQRYFNSALLKLLICGNFSFGIEEYLPTCQIGMGDIEIFAYDYCEAPTAQLNCQMYYFYGM